MNRRTRAIIITLAATVGSILLRRFLMRWDDDAVKAKSRVDGLEFPPHRAHVYLADPDEAANVASAGAKMVGCTEIARSTDGYIVAKVPYADNATFFVKIACVPLGPSHTRVVIESVSKIDQAHGKALETVIAGLQAYMDSRLTGG